MKLQFKYQKFQADAASAVADVFAGQPCQMLPYAIDRGRGYQQAGLTDDADFAGWANAKIAPWLTDGQILENLRRVQKANQLPPSPALEGRFNLTVEMETGVGKTYTYIKTMYELNKRYGWSKFIIVVPSIAIREGVYRSFEMTREHFTEEYGKPVWAFIYNSAQLSQIDRFASDSSICAMIINAQAFNAKGKDARRIYMELDGFRSRRPIDVIARTNPILIIDEPQSVEGRQTKENLQKFCPLMTLRYSATHKKDSIYNMVYRLDAVDAYNQRLVKKIAVKGITETGTTATESCVYLESVNLSLKAPTATLQFDCRSASGVRPCSRKAGVGFDLYEKSGHLAEYRDGFIVKEIDGRDDSVEFLNGIKLYAGDVTGKVSEEQLRRIQIRETILSHIERERRLFYRGIKVLSLFFIDEVAHYRQYDEKGQPQNGLFARMFEEEYREIVGSLQREMGDEAYIQYLEAIPVSRTHAGYFSIDKRGHMVNSKVGPKETTAEDMDAYDLIMKNKELLLDLDPVRSPARFLFSHSALREGWDNPNVFQICTLKQSASDVRKRQEVGRGLRLCVNQDGERMDANALGEDVHDVNVLTVIASESYDSFAKGLQTEMAEAMGTLDDASNVGVLRPMNARGADVELKIDRKKLESPEFQALWEQISQKSVYLVDFDTDKLVRSAIQALNTRLRVSRIYYRIEYGQMEEIRSRQELLAGEAMRKKTQGYHEKEKAPSDSGVKYDLIGRLVDETALTRRAVISILTGMEKTVFAQFADNPEEFIQKAAALINEQKAQAIMEHITYKAIDERMDTGVLTRACIRGKLGVNAMKTEKHLYDHLVYDSEKERAFAEELEAAREVELYVKLPRGFFISTPMGRYSPDWAIVFRDNGACPFFVAETKGTLEYSQYRLTEAAKIHCARRHFRAVCSDRVRYDVVDSFAALIQSRDAHMM